MASILQILKKAVGLIIGVASATFPNSGNYKLDFSSDSDKLRAEIEDLKRRCFKQVAQEATDFAKCWVKPCDDGLVISGASSWEENKSTVTGIVRDGSGLPPTSIAKPIYIRNIGLCESKEKAECICIFEMITFMLLNGASEFTIESGSLDSIRGITCPGVYVSDDRLKITLSILLLLNLEQPAISFAWVDNDRNEVATKLLQFGQHDEEGVFEYGYEEVDSAIRQRIEEEAEYKWQSDVGGDLRKIKYLFSRNK